MGDFEKFEKVVNFLFNEKGFMQKNIAEKIGVNKVSFNQTVTGARISKASEYLSLIYKHYGDDLKAMGEELPVLEKYTTQKQTWEIVLEKQEEILRGINQILENQKKQ